MSISIRNITKKYGEVNALQGISLEVKKGELFGLIGPDGSGKTTLFRIIATLLLPDSGTAEVSGYDIIKDYRKIRNIIGYMPGRFSLYQDLTVKENLSLFASIFGTTIEENYDLVKDIYSQIEPFSDRRAGKLSGGMKQKLALSCAMIHKPEVLILDEPTTGVDPVSRKEFWMMLKRLNEAGITIIVSTPYMDEADLCDRIGLIQSGKLLSLSTPAELTSRYRGKLFSVNTLSKFEMMRFLENRDTTSSVFIFGETLHYSDKRETVSAQVLNEEWRSFNNAQFQINEINPTVEDCFMALQKEIV